MYASVKKQLSFSEDAQLMYKDGRSLKKYLSRKSKQLKRLGTKPQIFRMKWQKRVVEFLEENSRVMPNKKDTILINGNPVAKRHLLITKFQAYRNCTQSHPDFGRKLSTFVKMFPRNMCSGPNMSACL